MRLHPQSAVRPTLRRKGRDGTCNSCKTHEPQWKQNSLGSWMRLGSLIIAFAMIVLVLRIHFGNTTWTTWSLLLVDLWPTCGHRVTASNKVQPEVLRRRGTTEGVGSGTAAKGNGKGIKKGPGQGEGAVKMKWLLVTWGICSRIVSSHDPSKQRCWWQYWGPFEEGAVTCGGTICLVQLPFPLSDAGRTFPSCSQA